MTVSTGVSTRAGLPILLALVGGCSAMDPLFGGSNGARRGDTLEIFDLSEGDLLITEIHKDPAAVSDARGEWIELRNMAALEVDVNGMVIEDNNGIYTVGVELIVPSGGTLVFGRNHDVLLNGGVTLDHEYSGISLSNANDEVTISDPTNGVVIDQVVYDNGATFPDDEGFSLTLDPGSFDEAENDIGGNWCIGWDTQYGDGDFGTPGADNDSCLAKDFDGDGSIDAAYGGDDCDDTDAGVNPSATEVLGNTVDENCDGYLTENGSEDLTAGQLVITEIMQNPKNTPDGDGEWFEFRNDSGNDVDLFGLVVSDESGQSFTITANLVVAAGAYGIFAVEDDIAENGNVDADWDWSGFTLSNGSDEVILTGPTGVEIDRVEWDNGATFPDPSGASMQLDPSTSNATDNDVGGRWCASRSAWDSGDLGSPKADNTTCSDIDGDGVITDAAPWNGGDCDDTDPDVNNLATEIEGNGVDEDCDGLDASSGLPSVTVGELVITEFHNHPSTSGSGAEWFEIRNISARSIDLIGLEVRDLGNDRFTVTDHLFAGADSAVILARSGDSTTNLGLAPDYVYGTSFLLSDVEDEIVIGDGTTEFDRVVYDSVDFPNVVGQTVQLDPTVTTVTGNDDPTNWCEAYVAYGNGTDEGTPQSTNLACFGRDVDGDGFVDANFGGDDCDDDDPLVNPGQAEVAGNGIDEDCDGIDAALGLDDLVRGDILITEIMKNSDEVVDNQGEWYEITNQTAQTVDLIRMFMEDDDGHRATVFTHLVAQPGEAVVLGREDDPALNGGYDNDYQYFNWALLNDTPDEILLIRPSDGLVLEEVRYDDGIIFPDPTGSSFQLSSDITSPDDNDLGVNWCVSRESFGDGDYGTPGDPNDSCDWRFEFDFSYAGPTTISGTTEAVLNRDGTFSSGNLGEGTWSMFGTADGQTITWTYDGTGVTYNGSRTEGGGCFSGDMANTGAFTGTWSQQTDCP